MHRFKTKSCISGHKLLIALSRGILIGIASIGILFCCRQNEKTPSSKIESQALAVSSPKSQLESVTTQTQANYTANSSTKETVDQTSLKAIDFWSLSNECYKIFTTGKNTSSAQAANYECDERLKALALKLFESMNADEKLAQLFMVTYLGAEPSASFLRWIQQRGVGGVKIFGWNAESTEVLVRSLRLIYKTADAGPYRIPPFVATDQEGGWIRHVKGATTITPGNMAIGASGWIDDAYWSGYYINKELYKLGILMNFAPTVDLATNPASTIIGSRAFSYNPEHTAYLGAAWMQGALNAGVVPVAKHFPGHGDTVYDSHGTLPVITVTKETLDKRELVPYKLLIKEGLPAIMSGHLAYPNITGTKEPASLSVTMITKILRNELEFDGLIITDDLVMQGALSEGNLEEACEKAIIAGNDMILISRELEPDGFLWTQLKKRYVTDKQFKNRVDESVKRILKAKLRYIGKIDRTYLLEIPSGGKNLEEKNERQFFFEQASRSVTKIGSLPFVPLTDTGDLLIVSQFYELTQEAKKMYPGSQVIKISYLPESLPVTEEIAAFRERLPSVKTVLVCVANQASAFYAEEALKQGKTVYVLSVLNPWHVRKFVNKANIIAVYSFARESFQAGLLALQGKLPLFGSFPITALE